MRTALLCAKTFFDRIAQGDLRICLGFLFARPNHFPDFCAALPCHSALNSQMFLCMFHKIAHPPPENSAFYLDILRSTALYLCRKETPGMKMRSYVIFCPEIPVFAGFRYRSR